MWPALSRSASEVRNSASLHRKSIRAMIGCSVSLVSTRNMIAALDSQLEWSLWQAVAACKKFLRQLGAAAVGIA